jgi:hypothetical protein
VYGGVVAGVDGVDDKEFLAFSHHPDTDELTPDELAPDVVSSPNPKNPPFIDLLLCFLGIYILLKEINI